MDYSEIFWPAFLWMIVWLIYIMLIMLILKACYDNEAGIKTWLFVIALCLATIFLSGPTYLVKNMVTRPYQSDLVADAYKKGIEGEPNYENEAKNYYKMSEKQKETIQDMIKGIDKQRLQTAYKYRMYIDADISDVNSICMATINRNPNILFSMFLLGLFPLGVLGVTLYLGNKRKEETEEWIRQKESASAKRIAYRKKKIEEKENEQDRYWKEKEKNDTKYWSRKRNEMDEEINKKAEIKVKELLKEHQDTIDKNRQTISEQEQTIKEQKAQIKENIRKLNDLLC